MDNKVTIKTNPDVERYDLRVNHEWATIMISREGLFLVESSYGVYGHWWYHHGRTTFKHFLVDLLRDPEYVMSKLGKRDFFDLDKTVISMQQELLRLRKHQGLSKDSIREAWDALVDYKDNHYGEPNLFVSDMSQYDAIAGHIFYDEINLVMDYNIQLREFMKNIFPVFVEHIKSEIYPKEVVLEDRYE